MHTSTVVVAVINPDIIVSDVYTKRLDDDFRIEWFSGTGKGGQARNKKMSCCRLVHLPTGLTETRQGRDRVSNLQQAKEAILVLLDSAMADEKGEILSEDRRNQMGSGARGDKTVTIRFQDDRATHHGTEKTISASKYMKGHMDLLW